VELTKTTLVVVMKMRQTSKHQQNGQARGAGHKQGHNCISESISKKQRRQGQRLGRLAHASPTDPTFSVWLHSPCSMCSPGSKAR